MYARVFFFFFFELKKSVSQKKKLSLLTEKCQKCHVEKRPLTFNILNFIVKFYVAVKI